MQPPQNRDLRPFFNMRKRRALNSLEEDVFLGDPTTTAVLKHDSIISGRVLALGPGVAAGIVEAVAILGKRNCQIRVKEGAVLSRGLVVLVVRGRASRVLPRIRVALNYLSHLSGLATQGRRLSDKFGKDRVAALRKTSPGLGFSEKAALQIGGVMPHRLNLGDSILVKKEHILLTQMETGFSKAKATGEATRRAVAYANRTGLGKRGGFVEIEVETLAQAVEAARAGPDTIMIDNASVLVFMRIAAVIRQTNKNIWIEASGGITERNAARYLKAGADFVSGSFVFRAEPVDFRFVLDG